MQSSPRLEEVTMSTSIERAPLDMRRDATARTTRISARQALLACGIVYALLYVIVNDVIAATLYDGYSRMSQAVSELSATGAPTRIAHRGRSRLQPVADRVRARHLAVGARQAVAPDRWCPRGRPRSHEFPRGSLARCPSGR